MAPPIVVAKRRIEGTEPPVWAYEPVTCPGCDGFGLIPDVPLGPVKCRSCMDHPPYQEQYEVPCGLCDGCGVLFEDGDASAEKLRLLGLARSTSAEDRKLFEEEVMRRTIEMAESRVSEEVDPW